MNNAASTDTGPTLDAARYPLLKSQVMPPIINKLEQRSDPLVILDCGYGLPETIAFFSDRPCRLYFGGFQEYYAAIPGTDSGDVAAREALWHELFRKEMNYPAGTRFDLCLFWDMFCYLDIPAVRGFIRALSPFIKPSTLAHAFMATSSRSSFPHRAYGLVTEDQLSLRPAETGGAKTYPRPQGTLSRELDRFAVDRGVLHQGSLLELSLMVKN